MATTLVLIGTKHYWRDDEARHFRAVDNAHIVTFDQVQRWNVKPEATQPDVKTTSVPSFGSPRPRFCDDCGSYFIDACNCANTPEQASSRLRMKV